MYSCHINHRNIQHVMLFQQISPYNLTQKVNLERSGGMFNVTISSPIDSDICPYTASDGIDYVYLVYGQVTLLCKIPPNITTAAPTEDPTSLPTAPSSAPSKYPTLTPTDYPTSIDDYFYPGRNGTFKMFRLLDVQLLDVVINANGSLWVNVYILHYRLKLLKLILILVVSM